MAPISTLPDTCAWIDFLNGRQTALANALEQVLVQGEAVTCGVVLYELIQGIRSTKEEALVLHAFQAMPHLEMTEKLWIEAGRLSAMLRKQGHTLPFSDIVIAVLALEHKLTILTVDQHFAVIPGIKTIGA